ncbi:MAG: hypothetical protein WD688_17180 [Candidatus Binatia bacterium]
MGIARAGDLSDRLSRAVVRKLGLPSEAVTIRPIGGSQSERYQAMAAGIVHGVIITPPLDVRARNEGYNVLYRLIELNLPFIYSSLHTSYKMLRERPEIVQRAVAALAEIVYFVEKNPEKAKASMAKAMRTNDQEALQSAYDVYARDSTAPWWSPATRSPTRWRSPAKAALLSEGKRKRSTTTAS